MSERIAPVPSSSKGPSVLLDREIDWDDVARAKKMSAANGQLVERARKAGARRKKLAKGDSGFFMNRSLFPADFRVPVHHHTHDELIVVLRGSCEFDDGVAVLASDDSIVIPAGFRYGFTCGAEGMEILTIRRAEAEFTVESD